MRRMGHSWRALLLMGCLGALLAAPALASDELGRIREKAAELAVAINGTLYDTYGEGKDSDLERAYNDYGYLLTPAKLKRVAELVAEATDPAERARREETLALLRYYALEAGVAPVLDNSRNAMRDNEVRLEGGETVVLRGLDFRLGLEADQDTRRKWALAASQLYTGTNVYLLNLIVDVNRHAVEMGYEDVFAFLREVQGWDAPLMASAAESLLAHTQVDYEVGLEKYAEAELNEIVRRIRTYDVRYLANFPRLSASVAWKKPTEIAKKTLGALGIDLGGQRSLRIDDRERAGREPGAQAYPLSTNKTRVTLSPTGMISELPDMLGAFGEAEFYHLIPGSVPFERAYFGTNILPMTYRMLLMLIAEEPAWIEEHLDLNGTTAAEVADALAFRRLLLLRDAAGRAIFQQQLYANPRIDPSVYNEVMERALVWRRTNNDADAYLTCNDYYQSGGELIGAVLALRIRDALRTEWGAEWFRNKALGDHLRQGAARGYGMSLSEFLSIWNLDGQDLASLVARAE